MKNLYEDAHISFHIHSHCTSSKIAKIFYRFASASISAKYVESEKEEDEKSVMEIHFMLDFHPILRAVILDPSGSWALIS